MFAYVSIQVQNAYVLDVSCRYSTLVTAMKWLDVHMQSNQMLISFGGHKMKGIQRNCMNKVQTAWHGTVFNRLNTMSWVK